MRTPALAFPKTDAHQGWHAAAFDSNGDGDVDLLLGGYEDEHLLEQVPSHEIDESALAGGVLPPFVDADPLAITGRAGRFPAENTASTKAERGRRSSRGGRAGFSPA